MCVSLYSEERQGGLRQCVCPSIRLSQCVCPSIRLPCQENGSADTCQRSGSLPGCRPGLALVTGGLLPPRRDATRGYYLSALRAELGMSQQQSPCASGLWPVLTASARSATIPSQPGSNNRVLTYFEGECPFPGWALSPAVPLYPRYANSSFALPSPAPGRDFRHACRYRSVHPKRPAQPRHGERPHASDRHVQ